MLWGAFILTVFLTVSFQLVSDYWDIVFLDRLRSSCESVARLIAYSPGQREVHIWVTSTLDVLYPLSYGALFAGLVLRAFPVAGSWMAIPALATVMTDLVEGGVQIALLLEARSDALVSVKVFLTNAKFLLFAIAFVLAIIALALMFFRVIRRRSAT